MSDTPKAVFISYAREDLASARRIADALGAFEVEVWFDQDGLEGGDAWDRKIRGQIKECALFVAVISSSTEARREAYFRLEWKLAEERTHLMAEGTSFLLPIAIDETPEAVALVPESFRRAQWMRLPRGVPNTQFVDRVRALLENQHRSHRPAAGGASDARPSRTGKKWALVAAVVALGVAASIPFWSKRDTVPSSVGSAPAALAEKSIAVLPFKNMSDDKENGFFADGVQDDILTNLQNIGDLRVISRTSVEEYRGTTKKIQQIARELGVAYLLEGSVRRAGGTVRIVCQLIDGRTGEHVLAPDPFDRDISNTFAIQSEIAKAIATKLHAVLSPAEKSRFAAAAPVTNGPAYELFLKARQIANVEPDLETLLRAETLLQSAVELDPRFAMAWGELGGIGSSIGNRVADPAGARRAKVRQAMETMQRLAPDQPDTWLRMSGYYLSREARDVAKSDSFLQRAAAALPNHGQVALLQAEAARRNGNGAESLALYRKAFELDRNNISFRNQLRDWLLFLRRYDDLTAFDRQDPHSDGYTPALVAFYARGSTREMDAWYAAHPDASVENLTYWRFLSGNAAEYVRLQDEARRKRPTATLTLAEESMYANAVSALGEITRARELKAANLTRSQTEKSGSYSDLRSLVIRGEKQRFLDEIKVLETKRLADRKAGINNDLARGGWPTAFLLAEVGEKDLAVAEFARLLSIPSGLNVHILRSSWTLKSVLHGYTPFEALLNDPKNNAPLL